MNSEVIKNFTLEIKKKESEEIGEDVAEYMYCNVESVNKNFLEYLQN